MTSNLSRAPARRLHLGRLERGAVPLLRAARSPPRRSSARSARTSGSRHRTARACRARRPRAPPSRSPRPPRGSRRVRRRRSRRRAAPRARGSPPASWRRSRAVIHEDDRAALELPSAARVPRYATSRRCSSSRSSASTRSNDARSMCSSRSTSRFRTIASPAIAPIASSGYIGTPSLRTTITSSGTPSAVAISNPTGTPPRGSASTVTSDRPAYSLQMRPRARGLRCGDRRIDP